MILQQKEIGNIQQDLSLSETELSMMNSISEKVNKSTLMIFWQFIFKGLEELSIVSNQILLLEMLVIRLLHLKDMPSYQSVLDLIKENELTDEKINLVQAKSIKNDSNNNLEIKKKPQKQIKTTGQIKIELETEREKNLSKIHIENISSFK